MELKRRYEKLNKRARSYLKKTYLAKTVLIGLAAIFGLALLAILITNQKRSTFKTTTTYPELLELASKDRSFQDLSLYFKTLATEKGAAYAYQVLRLAQTPPGIDIHLLGHVVGDVLFQQQGAKGIGVCTQDFRNACSHSVVIGLFQKESDQAIPEIISACKQAPGGLGAYTMCFHGLGHGILAYTGYDFPRTIGYCKKTASAQYNNREAIECAGGAVMEIISGGGHDHEIWAKKRELYLNKSSPLNLCLDKNSIAEEMKSICLTYVTPFLFEAGGADLGSPTPDNFRKSFSFCDSLDVTDASGRDACFGGFGKEFVVLAQNRDIRKIDQMNNQQFKTVVDWCQLTEVKDGQAACIVQALSSIYWGGENDPASALRFCGVIADKYLKNSCFINLIGEVFYFNRQTEAIRNFCPRLPDEYQPECNRRLSDIKTSR